MNRNRKRGTLNKGVPVKSTPRESILGQMLFETRSQLLAAQADALVSKTMLAAVLATVGDVTIPPETIADLQGKPFSIEKMTTEAGGLIVRATVVPDVMAEILTAENEGMLP